jgi:hypothetical protein
LPWRSLEGREEGATVKDPLALWRTKDPLSLSEAGALVCDVPPSRTYPHKIPEFTAEMRAERDMVQATRVALRQDAEAGKLPAKLRWEQSGGERRDRFLVRRWGDDRDAFEPVKRWIDLDGSTVTRADLEAWCSARGLRPAVLFPDARKEPQQLASADDLPAKAQRTALAMIAALADLAELDIKAPHAEPGVADEVAAKIEARFGFKIGRRTIADWLKRARDLS